MHITEPLLRITKPPRAYCVSDFALANEGIWARDYLQ